MSRHYLQLIVPPHTVDYFPPGVECTDPQNGDLFLVDHGTTIDKLVGVGQAIEAELEPELKDFTWCRHTAYFRDGMVSEMGPRGYERRLLSDYAAHQYARVRFQVSAEALARCDSYDVACSDVEYDFGAYASLVLDGITHSEFEVMLGDDLICSAHCALVLVGLGLFPDRAVRIVIPARLGMWLGARWVVLTTGQDAH
jgi:hypothetical protein